LLNSFIEGARMEGLKNKDLWSMDKRGNE
jgi:hypothetical protein